MNFYKHYIGDYQRDTGHLSLAEHGAYRLMLDIFYATGKPLPAGKKVLYRLLRAAAPAERKAIDAVLAQFWETTPEGLVNRRAAAEIEKADRQAEVNRQIAIERERRKRQRLEETFSPSPCIDPGMEESIGNGALSDPVHESDKVFEVCKVNNTHIVASAQPLSCTNRATDDGQGVAREDVADGGLSREPIHSHNQNHSQNHSQNHNHSQNRNEKGCGNRATPFSEGEDSHGPLASCAGGDGRKGRAAKDEGDGRDGAGACNAPVLPEDGAADGGGGGFAPVVLPDTGMAVRGNGAPETESGDVSRTKAVSASLARAMQRAGIRVVAGDPRLMALASQGVDVDTVVAACSEARRARPDESIGMAYVVRIVERWSRDARSIAARGARAHGRGCVHEERKKVLDELTGRCFSGTALSPSGVPLTLDGSVREVGKDDFRG